MLARVDDATAFVVTVNVFEAVPAATTRLEGTVAAAELLLERLTVAPPAGAMPVSITVAVEGVPPITLAGLTARADSAGGATVRVAVCVDWPWVAVMETDVVTVTADVVTVKVADI